MPDPVEISGPLEGFTDDRLCATGQGELVLGPCRDQGKLLIKLSAGDDDARSALSVALATEIPERHSRLLPTARVLAMAPQEWLWHGPDAELQDVKDRVAAALVPRPSALIDMSSGLVGVLVKGRRAVGLLQAGCPADLSETVFLKGHVARSLFGRYSVTVLCGEAQDEFTVYVARSYARSLCASMIAQAAHWGVSWLQDDGTPATTGEMRAR